MSAYMDRWTRMTSMKNMRVAVVWRSGAAARFEPDSLCFPPPAPAPAPLLLPCFVHSSTAQSQITYPTRLTLGTACILAADCYLADDRSQEKRGNRRESVFVKAVVRIVMSGHYEGEILWTETGKLS